MTTPVIFLDIDGVLNRTQSKSAKRHVDRDLLSRFERLVTITNSRVVLASTWRHNAEGLADARRLGVPFDDVLPDLRPQSRGREVETWLAQHPQTKRFAIIDDEDDGYGKLPLFQPNPKIGLTSQLTDAVQAYLCGKRDRDMRRNPLLLFCQSVCFSITGHKG